jgi:hypothetical protein
MKKNDLIKILVAIEGNPEIVLWNGFVEDVVAIEPKVVTVRLTKMSRDYWFQSVLREEQRDKEDWTFQYTEHEKAAIYKSYNKNVKWELNDFVTYEDIDSGKYLEKYVKVVQSKIKGIRTFDRQGTMSY